MIHIHVFGAVLISSDELECLLKEAFPDSLIEVVDTVGDQNHYEVTIASSLFNNKTSLQQHKLVYKALEGYVGSKIHALTLHTKGIS